MEGMALKHLAFLVLMVPLAGCSDSGDGEKAGDYDPGVSASDFLPGQAIDHPFLPYPRGASWSYDVANGEEHIEVRVQDDTKMIMGVQATVVRDTVTMDGEVKEDTFDWYAQDRDGNVWYLGEDTAEYEDGVIVSRGGSWEWGKDGALPGIIMKADPVPDNQEYWQEYYAGEAEDKAAVIDRNREVSTPAGTFRDTVTTREWSNLESGSEETVNYARGVGLLSKVPVGGSSEGESLVAYHVP